MVLSSPLHRSHRHPPDPSRNSASTKALETLVESVTHGIHAISMHALVDSGVIHLMADYGFPIDNVAASLAQYHGARYFNMGILLKDHGIQIDPSSVNIAQFHASLCHQVQDINIQMKVENALLLLNECCKLVSDNLQDDVLVKRLDEFEFKAFRASIELEEMDKELSGCPVMMRAYATQELKESEAWFCRLAEKWKQLSLDPLIELLQMLSSSLAAGSPLSASDVVKALKDLGKHPVFGGILSVNRNHVAQVTRKVKNEPSSWLYVFSMPPLFKISALTQKFAGQKQALAAVGYTFLRWSNDTSSKCKPVGSFLVCDPSGQYWEEFARSLSQMLFDTSDVSVRITLSLSDGSTSGTSRHDSLRKLFEDVRRRPYGVIIFEKIGEAEDSAIRILNQILETGCASYGGDASTDFTKSVILIILQDVSPSVLMPCQCIKVLCDHPFKSYLGATPSSSGAQCSCRCVTMLNEASNYVNAKTLQLVDDVALFGLQNPAFLAAYARTILREMAEDFCDGRLIVYPSEAALRMIMWRADEVNGEKAVKCWLEKNVRPVLANLMNKGAINDNSVVLVDKYAGSTLLSYMIESREDHCRGSRAKKFKNCAATMRLAYEKGKYLEHCIVCLIEKLHDFSRSGAKQEVITLIQKALSAASDLESAKDALGSLEAETNVTMGNGLSTASDLGPAAKEALGSLVRETDSVDRVNKRLKTEQEALHSGLDGSSECPVIITTILNDLLKPRGSSAVSFLLLGLRDDGKKELLNELGRNFADDDTVRIFAIDMSEYSDQWSLFRVKNSPLRTFNNDEEKLVLVEAARKHPYSIFYFDKIEKAHITVYGWLLSLLRYGVLIDGHGNEVDFGKTLVIFGSDSGNQYAFARLVGHNIDSTTEAGSGQEMRKIEACRLRNELVCKVDRLVVFNPFAVSQLKSMRSYQVEDLRYWAVGNHSIDLFYMFSVIFYGEVPRRLLKLLDKLGSNEEKKDMRSYLSQEWLPGWLPCLRDPGLSGYSSFIRGLPFV